MSEGGLDAHRSGGRGAGDGAGTGVSCILEGAAGYLILRRLTTDEETLRSAHFDSLLRAAAADCVVQVSDAYEALQPGKFMAALGRNGGEAE